jgi:hypothetical protein
MTDVAPRPRSATELIDATFQVYRRRPSQFITVAAIGYVPWGLVSLWARPSTSLSPGDLLATFVPVLIAAIGGIIVYPVVAGVINLITADVVNGREPDLHASARSVIKQYGTLVMATFLRGLFLFAGVLALLVGSLYVAARLFAVVPAVVIEGASAPDSLRRSSSLSEDLKLHILGTLILMFLIYLVFNFGVGLLATTIGRNPYLAEIIGLVFTPLIAPLFHILETLLYYDARIRREGFDIELMVSELAPQPGTSAAPSGSAP